MGIIKTDAYNYISKQFRAFHTHTNTHINVVFNQHVYVSSNLKNSCFLFQEKLPF
jgi:hypothetical protein